METSEGPEGQKEVQDHGEQKLEESSSSASSSSSSSSSSASSSKEPVGEDAKKVVQEKEDAEKELEEAEEEGKKSLSWMGSWTKKTLQQASKAQSQLGELLTRPGKKLKELNDENIAIRRRFKELSNDILTVGLRIDGKQTCGSLQVLRGGVSYGDHGSVIDAEEDKKLISISWHRKRNGMNHWDEIPEASGGFYRTTVDDVGCRICAKIKPTSLYHRLLSQNFPSSSSSSSPSQNANEDQKHKQKPNSKQNANEDEKQSQKHTVNDRTLVVEKPNVVELSLPVKEALNKCDPTKDIVNFTVRSKHDPLRKANLSIDMTDENENVLIIGIRNIKEIDSSGQAETSDDTDSDSASERTVDENENLISTLSKGAIARLPQDAVRILANPKQEKGLFLKLGTIPTQLDLSANSNMERDMIIVLIRKYRSKVMKYAPSHRYDQDQKAEDKMRFPVQDCIYSEVWDQLEFKGTETKDSSAKPSSSGPSSTKQTTKKMLQSMSSILSTAFDPLGSEVPTSSSSSTSSSLRPSSSFSSLSKLSSTTTTTDASEIEGNQANDPLDEEASFDLYSTAGFGKHFTVTIDLKEGEGLGISLSLFQVVRSKNRQLLFPETGASCVCVSGFSPITQDGEQIQGQLEKCELIRTGDALVAIQGIKIEPTNVKTKRDLQRYTACSLAHVAKIVGDARKSSEACKLSFTFAQGGGGSGHYGIVANDAKLKEKAEKLRTKLLTANSRLNTVFVTSEERLGKQSKRIDQLCEFIEEQQQANERSLIEGMLAQEQLEHLKARVISERQQWGQDKQSLKQLVEQANKRASLMQSEKDKAEQRIARLEADMNELANEGEAWVNTIGTKEDALRQLETEMRAHKIKYENLESLLDSSTTERSRLRDELGDKDSIIANLEEQVESMRKRLDDADDEADSLTCKMRVIQEEAENSVQRAKHEASRAQAELNEVKDRLSVIQTHSNAMKEAVQSAESRVQIESKARQDAESDLNNHKERVIQLTERIAQLQSRIREEGTRGPSNSTSSSSSLSATCDADQQIADLEGANAALRAQLKSLKSKVQSLTFEASKAAQLDQVLAENNDLVVKVQLEKAKRLESEDELSAYKRALRKMAEQTKREDPERWASRPQIFDHLYKRMMSEDK